ncbi:MAG: helix-turn-helix domain-containing protein [Oscillospiraceae bacterium]|jgi:AraC-like DNA-binding protein/DNA gyrase inhibitor GyrI|nr:helix-turn-helix domain-containing protein [Oscillospiraceae bacterium]
MHLVRANPVDAIIADIEQNIAADVDLTALAARHYISPRQLYRDFYARTGYSLAEYVRCRRVSNACERIRCSDAPLAVIAEECGCQSQAAFHKLFKSMVGLTPRAYRQGCGFFSFYPFPQDAISLRVNVGKETLPAWNIWPYYDPCLQGIEDRALASRGNVRGRLFGRNGKQLGNRLCYELMTEVPGPGRAGTYATCVAPYREKDINAAWDYLYNIWLPASMFEQSDEGYFEEYLFRNGAPQRLKLFLPVQKRREAQHIRIVREPERIFLIARATGPLAERRAAETVMDFLQSRYPLLVRSARRFYVCETPGRVACGVECPSPIPLPDENGTEFLRLPAGDYAVLPDDRLGDPRVGAAKLTQWAQSNSVACADTPAFAVYETPPGQYDRETIRMKLYLQLK